LTKIILKKGGRASEPFVADKIRVSIERAVEDALLPDVIAERIIRETYYETIVYIMRSEEVSSADIRNRIIKILLSDAQNKDKNAVAEAWIEYERRFK